MRERGVQPVKSGKRDKLFAAILACVAIIVVTLVGARLFHRRTTVPAPRSQKYEFLSTEPDWYVSDPVVGFLHRPSAKREFGWPEHSRGRIEMITNEMGFREDRETARAVARGTHRFLVVGDSHIDGVVYNSESFPHQLEAELTRANAGARYEVLNAGTGMFGPEQYARIFEKYATLEPEVFVVVVYTGNDFADILDTDAVQHPPKYFDDLVAGAEIDRPAIEQALNQVYFFKFHRELLPVALTRTYEQFELLMKRCDEEGVRLYVVLLPTKLDVEWKDDEDRLNRVARKLELSPEDLAINQSLRLELGKWLEGKRIRYWDAAAELGRADRPAFWRKDYHLSVEGHRILGLEFARKFGPRP